MMPVERSVPMVGAAQAAAPPVTAIIPTWEGEKLLRRCLPSVVSAVAAVGGEIVVIENGSRDGSLAFLEDDYPQIRIVRNERNVGFTRAVNQGIAAARGGLLLLLNNDVVLSAETLRGLMEFLERPDQARTGAVTPRLVNEDGSTQPICSSLPCIVAMYVDGLGVTGLWPMNPWRRHDPILRWNHSGTAAVGHAGASCLLVRRKAAEQAGPLDERLVILWSDQDWSMALREHGWQMVYCWEQTALHLGSQSIARPDRDMRVQMYRDSYRFHRKHFGALAWPLWLALQVKILLAMVRFRAPRPDRTSARLVADSA